MAPTAFPRHSNSANTEKYLTVGLIAGSVSIAVLLCLLFLRRRRSRANRKRIAQRKAASRLIESVVQSVVAESDTSSIRIPSPDLSQHKLLTPIVTPEKCITRKSSPYDIFDKADASSQLEASSASSTLSFPHPSSNAPFDPPRSRVMSILNPASTRHSRSSSGFTGYAQYLFPPGLNRRPLSTISTFSGVSSQTVRLVRQLFEPALPDELALVRYGEYLTVLRSFDDGWCLVARETLCASPVSPVSPASPASRFSTWMTNSTNSADVGLVPTWVFIKPLKGITVTRPFRIDSINALSSFPESNLR